MFVTLVFGAALFGAPPPSAERTADYRCDGGVSISVRFEKRGSAVVMIEGGAYRLKSAGANRWSDGQGQELVVGESDATWTSGVEGVRKCAESGE